MIRTVIRGSMALLIAVGVATLLIGRLLLGGAVGVADQGDGHRLMCSAGVADPAAGDPAGRGYVHLLWQAHQWYGETCGTDRFGGLGGLNPSTEPWLLWPAKLLSPTLFHAAPGDLDLRALGVLCSVLAGLLCCALFLVLPGGARRRAFIAAGIGLVLADAAFAGYFISPYSEPAALLGILATVVALIVIWRRGRTTWPTLLAAAAAAAFTIATDAQTVSYAIPVGLGILAVPHCRTRRHGNRRLAAWAARRRPGLAVAGLLAAFSAAFLAAQPQQDMDQTRYDLVFQELLPHSPDSAGDLRDLGLDSSWIGAMGGQSDAVARTLAYETFRHKVGWPAIGEFYLAHPSRLGPMFSRGLESALQLRPADLGSFPRGAGRPPAAQEHRITPYSTIFELFRWAHFLVITEWLLLLLAGLLIIKHDTLGAGHKAHGHLALWVAIAIAAQFVVVTLTGGGVATRSFVLVDYLVAIGLPLLASCGQLLLTEMRKALEYGGPLSSAQPLMTSGR